MRFGSGRWGIGFTNPAAAADLPASTLVRSGRPTSQIKPRRGTLEVNLPNRAKGHFGKVRIVGCFQLIR